MTFVGIRHTDDTQTYMEAKHHTHIKKKKNKPLRSLTVSQNFKDLRITIDLCRMRERGGQKEEEEDG